MIIPQVPVSKEFQRIDSLPRRVYTSEELIEITARMTEALRTVIGSQKLLPAQAIALLELGMYGRLLAPLRPGAGKSLICFCAPYVLDRKRAVLLLPGKHVEPKRRELITYGKDWKVAWWLRLLSYQSLSRISHEDFLLEYKPTLILADEAHKLKNPKAGVTKRLIYYLDTVGKEVGCIFVPLSGTFTDRSPGDWAHLAKMALGDQSPLPATYKDLQIWIQALGEKLQGPRARPGALLKWSENRSADLEAVRKGFGRRVRETPSVVATESPLPSISLIVERVELDSDPAIEEAFKRLKDSWETLDGWPLTQGLQVWQTAKQYKHGFYYYYSPRPSQEYLDRRRSWSRFVRDNLDSSPELATELQIVNRCIAGDIDPTAYNSWKEIETTYTGQRYAKWFSTVALDYCRQWLKHPGICWVEHTEFGEALSYLTNVPYHGSAGLDKNRIHLESRKGEPVISGMGSSEGLNLQHAYSRFLLTSPMAQGRAWEQWLARFHRLGQPEDEVTAEILSGCRADETSWNQAVLDAKNLSASECLQRLDIADKIWNADLQKLQRVGYRWKDLAKRK